MNDQLLQTKLYHARLPSNLVPRPRLIQLLDEGLAYGRKLAFVCAPAGFGKTTLVAEWIHTMDRPVGWLSLDEGDNDPSRFLAYFIAALQSIGPELVEVANAALGSPQPVPMEAVLTVVINSITRCSAPLALVLDDYHLIEAQAVHKMLAFLLDHQPPELHLVIITRAEGPGPAAGGGARGQGHSSSKPGTGLLARRAIAGGRVRVEGSPKAGRAGRQSVWAGAARIFLARTRASQGKLRQAETMLREIVTTGETSPILSLAHFDLASLYYERNELDKAEERLNLGVVLSEPSRNADFQNAGTVLLALLRLAQGDTAKALEAAERSQKLVKNQYLPARARSAALHVQVALAMGNPETAVRWGEQVTFGVDTNSYLRFLDLTQPRLLIALDRKEEASERLRACYEKSVRSSVLRVHRQVT